MDSMFHLLPFAFLLILQPSRAVERKIKILVAIDMDYSSTWESDIFAVVRSFAHFASKKYLQGRDLSLVLIEDQNITFEKDEDELSILLTIAPCNSTWSLYRQLQNDKVLLVAVTEVDCPRLPIFEALTIPLMNREEQISQIILDLRSDNVLQWKEAIIVYDDSISSHLADRVAKVLSEDTYDRRASLTSISTAILKLDDTERENTIQTQAMQFFSGSRTCRSHVNFLGFLKPENMEIILEQAQRMGLVHTHNHWLFCLRNLKKNATSYASLVNEGGHVAFLYATPTDPPTRKKNPRDHLLHANRASGSRVTAEEVDESVAVGGGSILRQEMARVIFTLAKSLKRLDEAEVEIFSRVSEEEWEALRPTARDHRDALLSYLKEGFGEAEEWRVTAVLSWSGVPSSAAQLLPVATWNPRVGLVSTDHVFPHARHGFRGKRVRIVTFHQNPPWSTLRLNDSGTIVERKGVIFDILDELARNLNFSYSLVLPKEGGGGGVKGRARGGPTHPYRNSGNISALVTRAVNVVRRGEALLGASAFVASPRLESLVSATAPLANEQHAFLTSRPQVLSRALIFMAPFSSDTWLCIAVSVLLMGPVLFWVHNLTPYYEFHGLRYKNKITRKAKRKLSIVVKLTAFDKVWKCLWYVYGALLQQGGIQVPMADSGRIVIGTWWLVVIVVMTTYCGNLVAFLTFPTVSTTISTLDELVEALDDSNGGQRMTLGIIDEAADRVNLKEAADPRLRHLSSLAHVHEPSATMDTNHSEAEGRMLDGVRHGRHILIARLSHLMMLTEEDYLNIKRCDFQLGRETFLGENLVMIAARNSPYLVLINEEIKKMHHGGLIQKWTADSLPKKGLCKDKSHEHSGSTEGKSETAKSREVKLDDMQGSFFVLFIGCFLALITISLEYAWHQRDTIRERFINK